MMRTVQLLSIAGILFGSAKAQQDSLKGYVGLKLESDKSFVTLGKNADVKFYRDNGGGLKIAAKSVDIQTNQGLVANGRPVGASGGGGGPVDSSLADRVARLENGGVLPQKNYKATCSADFGYEKIAAWNTKKKNHDIDLTKTFQQFDTDASVLMDGDTKTGLKIDQNIFWYIGVKFSNECASATFNFALTSNLHHLRTAYSSDGKKWTCASNYLDRGNARRTFTGCKGGRAASYHGRTQTISFTKKAKYYAFGFRDAGLVSKLTMKCQGKTVKPAVHRFRNGNSCTKCPSDSGCNGRVKCKKTMWTNGQDECKPCPKGSTCNGVTSRRCGTKNGIEVVKAWPTGQRHHDVDLTRGFSKFTTNAMTLRDGSGSTGISVVSNYFWYFGVKLASPCTYAEFNFKLTSNLHHLRTAYSQNGEQWTCASDYTGHDNNNRKFTGCKGGNAYKYHGRHQTIRFTVKAQYYAFGFRDAGTVSEITGKCNSVVLGTPQVSTAINNKCVKCPSGSACVDGKATPCGNMWADGGKCKKCPDDYVCKNGVGKLCTRTFGIESVRAWNSNKRTHDLDMTVSWSDLNTDANILLDGSTSTYLNVVSNYFWWFGVKLSEPCRNAIFTFTMTSNLHHLRTAYSMDGETWTCQSEYRDTGNNLRKINGICQGGNAASYHSNSNKQITFKSRAAYYAFGFRDAGRVSRLTMKCEGKNVNFNTQEKYAVKGECKSCPKTYSCASGKPIKLQMEKVMAWNTNQKTHDHDLSASFSQFTTNAASLVDGNTGGTGINVVSNYFWWFAVKLTAECYKAKFSFLMTSNLHHLRTAYSQDGEQWTCASDFQDTGNNRRTHSNCKGGRAASYHSNKNKMIYFSAAAKYYAFGFRDAGKVTNLKMWCGTDVVPRK